MFKSTITTLFLSVILSTSVFQTSLAASSEIEKVHIRGVVRTKDGLPLKDIKVVCFYFMKPDFPGSLSQQITDDNGRYDFEVSVGQTYWIAAGGRKSTFIESKKYITQSKADVTIEDLIVRPYSVKISGNVIFEDGKPAANLAYGYLSENCSPIDAQNPPRTNSNGEFAIDYLLPDELYSFWIFTDTNVFRVWKRLDPNIPKLQLTLKQSDYIELPEDWLYAGNTHHAIARSMEYAENSIIDFKLPDLNGKIISLSDEMFKNKAVIVNITGTWCGGCKQEVPYLVKYYEKYKNKGLEIISISFERDTKEEALRLVRNFKSKNKINYTMLYGGITDKKNVESVITGLKLFNGYPTTIYIGRDGKVQYMHSGFYIPTNPHKKWQLDLMESHINEILADVK